MDAEGRAQAATHRQSESGGRAVADVVECWWWLSSCLGNEKGIDCRLCTEDSGLSGEVGFTDDCVRRSCAEGGCPEISCVI
jgi:hypothetical protein